MRSTLMTSQAGPYGVSLTFSYDSADRLTTVQDSLGGTQTSVYDAAGQLTSRQLSGNSMQARIDATYNADGSLTGLSRYSDVGGTTLVGTTSYSYDNAQRVTAITNKSAGGTTLSSYTTTYDNADRATSDSWSATVGTTTYSGTHSYTYDQASQLLSDGVQTYSYDSNGNRTMSGYATGAGNQLTTDGTWTYTYDSAGNEVEKTQGSGSGSLTWTYGYDNLNRLVSAVEVNGTGTTLAQVTYTYDVFNNLIQDSAYTSSSGLTTVTRHLYLGGNIVADFDTSGNVEARYLNGDALGQHWARLIPAGYANAGLAWYLMDREGSVRDLMDNTGALSDHLDYSGYGSTVLETNSGVSDGNKYAGGWTDPLTGNQDDENRWLQLSNGMWMTIDPIQFGSGTFNLYDEVGNSPTNATDPSGLSEEHVTVAREYADDRASGTSPTDAILQLSRVFNAPAFAGSRLYQWIVSLSAPKGPQFKPHVPYIFVGTWLVADERKVMDAVSDACEEMDTALRHLLHTSANDIRKTNVGVGNDLKKMVGSGRGLVTVRDYYLQQTFFLLASMTDGQGITFKQGVASQTGKLFVPVDEDRLGLRTPTLSEPGTIYVSPLFLAPAMTPDARASDMRHELGRLLAGFLEDTGSPKLDTSR